MQDSIACHHILIKHNKSRTPLDRVRNIPVTRTKDEAYNMISEIRELVIKEKDSFKKYASKYSECASGLEEGNLGFFSKGDMNPEFEECAFNLKVGEISNIVSTDSGLHIILRVQ